jgi:hypothetical protein
VISPSLSILAIKPANSGSTTSSGRKVVITLPSQSRDPGDLGVMQERVQRAFGGGEQLDVEALEQGARAEFRARFNAAPIRSKNHRRSRRKALLDAEHLAEHMIEPLPRRRAAKQIIVIGEQPPDFAAIRVPPRRRRDPRCPGG